MPTPIKFEQKNVKLNNKTKKILEILKRVKDENNIDANPLNEQAITQEPGLWGKGLKFIETITGQRHNAEGIIFASDYINVDDSAYTLYQDYKFYLNETLKDMNISAANEQKKDISNHYIVVREILLRLVALTLTVKDDEVKNGNKMIKLLGDFIGNIKKEEILITKSIGQKKLTTFAIKMAEPHDLWLERFKSMVDTIQNINLPRTSFEELKKFLIHDKHLIAQHIIAKSGYKETKDGEISYDWIRNTFHKFVKHYSPNSEISKCLDTTKQDDWQTEICLKTGNKQLKPLFNLLNQANLLLEIVDNILPLINIGGWLSIASGAIDISEVIKINSLYDVNRQLHLKISTEEYTKNKSNINFIEIAKNSNLTSPQIIDINKNIQLLQSPNIRKEIFNQIAKNLQNLSQLETKIKGCMNTTQSFHLINPEIAKDFGRDLRNLEPKTNTNQEIEHHLEDKSCEEIKYSMSGQRFKELMKTYKTKDTARKLANMITNTSGPSTTQLDEEASSDAISDHDRACLVEKYLSNTANKKNGFYIFLKEREKEGTLYDRKEIIRNIPVKITSTSKNTANQPTHSIPNNNQQSTNEPRSSNDSRPAPNTEQNLTNSASSTSSIQRINSGLLPDDFTNALIEQCKNMDPATTTTNASFLLYKNTLAQYSQSEKANSSKIFKLCLTICLRWKDAGKELIAPFLSSIKNFTFELLEKGQVTIALKCQAWNAKYYLHDSLGYLRLDSTKKSMLFLRAEDDYETFKISSKLENSTPAYYVNSSGEVKGTNKKFLCEKINSNQESFLLTPSKGFFKLSPSKWPNAHLRAGWGGEVVSRNSDAKNREIFDMEVITTSSNTR